MRRELPGGYELDDDPARIDVDAVHDYLANHSYWAAGRPRDVVEHTIRNSLRVVGLYDDGRLAGFARTVTDEHVIAYLADVFVLPEHQGHGLGVELVRFTVEDGPYSHLRWLLHTRDAHGLYERFAFAPPDERLM